MKDLRFLENILETCGTDYIFTSSCEDCSHRTAYTIWENWCNGYIVTRFKCSHCGYEWDDIWNDVVTYGP
jgi:hypothetical protein